MKGSDANELHFVLMLKFDILLYYYYYLLNVRIIYNKYF